MTFRLPALPPAFVLLDLDGTLTDSAPGTSARSARPSPRRVCPCPTTQPLRRFVGRPLPLMLRESGVPADRVDELVATYRRHFTAGGMFDNAVFPGIPEALVALGTRVPCSPSRPPSPRCTHGRSPSTSAWTRS